MTNDKKSCSSKLWINLGWWATLVVSVIAVPSFGFAVAALIPVKGIGELIVFILACWLCTYIGMRLMMHPGMEKPLVPVKKKDDQL